MFSSWILYFLEYETLLLDSLKLNSIGKNVTIGNRNRHEFSCSCGFSQHADINAADNIRLSYAVLRNGGLHINQPRSPVVITNHVGKHLSDDKCS
jgi:hypothetical protein